MKKKIALLTISIIAALAFVACADKVSTAVPTAAPTATVAPTAEVTATPTAEVTPTATPIPTATPTTGPSVKEVRTDIVDEEGYVSKYSVRYYINGALKEEKIFSATNDALEEIREYNGKFQVSKVYYYNWVGDFIFSDEMKYDIKGKVTLLVRYDSEGKMTEKEEKAYDSNGYLSLVAKTDSEGIVYDKQEMENDAKGNVLKLTCSNKSGIFYYIISEYDNNNNKTKKTKYNADGAVDYICETDYTDEACVKNTYHLERFEDEFWCDDFSLSVPSESTFYFGGKKRYTIVSDGVKQWNDIYTSFIYYPDGSLAYEFTNGKEYEEYLKQTAYYYKNDGTLDYTIKRSFDYDGDETSAVRINADGSENKDFGLNIELKETNVRETDIPMYDGEGGGFKNKADIVDKDGNYILTCEYGWDAQTCGANSWVYVYDENDERVLKNKGDYLYIAPNGKYRYYACPFWDKVMDNYLYAIELEDGTLYMSAFDYVGP